MNEARRVGWLVEAGGGSESLPPIYGEIFTDIKFLPYRSPRQLLDHLVQPHDGFFLGMICNLDPYPLGETDGGTAVGLRLYDDIRSQEKYKDTPIVVLATTAHLNPRITEKGLTGITIMGQSSIEKALQKLFPGYSIPFI